MSGTVLRDGNPTARKPHICGYCNRTIHPGEKYQRSTIVGDHGLYDWINCQECGDLVPVVWEYAGCPYDEGLGWESFTDWAEDSQHDPQYTLAALAYMARRNQR